MSSALALAAAGCRPIGPLNLSVLRAAARCGGIPGKPGGNPMPRPTPLLPERHTRRGDLHLAPRCQAHCKHDRRPCRQPAMRGKRVCRMHGGKAGAPRGRRNGAYRHGGRTLASRELLRMATRERRRLAAALAVLKAETRYERSATVRRIMARRPDGGIGPATEVTMHGRRVWRDGGPARALRAFQALGVTGSAVSALNNVVQDRDTGARRQPFFAKASKGILLRAAGHASTLRSAEGAKQDGGAHAMKTRTISSQLHYDCHGQNPSASPPVLVRRWVRRLSLALSFAGLRLA